LTGVDGGLTALGNTVHYNMRMFYGPSSQFSTATSFRRLRTVRYYRASWPLRRTVLPSTPLPLRLTLYRRFEVSKVPAPARTNSSHLNRSQSSDHKLTCLFHVPEACRKQSPLRLSLRPHTHRHTWTHTVKRTVVCILGKVTVVCVLYGFSFLVYTTLRSRRVRVL
jgi:hypothetical protein